MLASGRPIVAMAAHGTSLAREIEQAGIVVAPGDAKALAGAIMALADNQSLRMHLGTAARKQAQQRWDRTELICSLESEFHALARSGAVTASRRMQPANSYRPVAKP
jgi:colanic acid biosynthesis glycosyl transferase WcaI